MMRLPFADLHHHVLWGLDDGPQTPEQMQAQLKMAHEDGISLIAATCHAYPMAKPFDIALYRLRLEEANAFCRQNSLPLQLVQGCEILYNDRVPDLLRNGALPALGDTRYVLVEFQDDVLPKEIDSAANHLYQAGYWPILAHVERYRCLVHSPKRAIQMRDDLGLLYQINCETILNPHVLFESRFVHKLLDEHAIDLIATDAHDLRLRSVNMQRAYLHLEQHSADLAQRLIAQSWQIIGKTKKPFGF